MAKKLIITEKPSVARDFARVLGVSGNRNGYIENDTYVISWCVGHLVEMLYPEAYDEKYKRWKAEDLPFLPAEYKYGVIEAVKQQYQIVNDLLHREDIDVVYWAGDSGKEGQTIEENIRNYGGVREGMQELRVWIDSQTDDEILRGINEAKPMDAYKNLGKSGIMRSIEDYALGINFSRALSVKYGKLINDAAATKSYTAIAVGRVMTCVLGMVVIREREIRNFVETPFYRVVGNFTDDKLPGEWKVNEKSKYFDSPLLYKENGFKKEESAKQLIDECTNEKAIIDSIDKSTMRKKAPLLFNLAELQAECAKRFKISPDQTLQVAQDLYEKKLTTYPRTDARVLTTAVAKEITKNLNKLKSYDPTTQFVSNILEKRLYTGIEKTSYVDDSKVTDHYAIIPTGQIGGLSQLSDLHCRVYEIIVKRFLSIFYPPAEFAQVKVVINIHDELFYMSAKVLEKLGYMEISGVQNQNDNEDNESEDSKKKILSLVQKYEKGDEIEVDSFSIKQGKTSPPKRYTSGTMILAMENAGNLIEDDDLRAQIKNTGIGTSATRAEIIKKLVKIGYLNLNAKTQILTPENLGEMIYEVVNMSVPSLLNPQMTASWEKGLEGITNGTVIMEEYRTKLEDYIRQATLSMIENNLTNDIAGKINQFTGKDAKGIAAKKRLGIPCPICGGELCTTSFGYGCSNFFNKEINCKFNVGKIAGVELEEDDFKDLITNGRTKVIKGFTSSKKKAFKAALVLKKDDSGKLEVVFDFSQNTPDYLENVTCPNCGGKIQQTSFGFGCANYHPEDPSSCKFSIGRIAGKDLSEAQVIELLTNGKTQTIRGFKSKSGKKFDACLKLAKDDHDENHVEFDFEDVEAKLIKDVKCPLCGGDIVKTSFGYGCHNYSRENPESCRFSIGKLAGKELTESQLRELINTGRTSTIYGFKSKSGAKFDARIVLKKDEEGKITGCGFDFTDLEHKKLKDAKCPICGGDIVITHFGYCCSNHKQDDPESCRFSIGQIAGVSLNEKQAYQLFTEKHTDVIEGFVAKTGMKFNAPLKILEDGHVAFDFPEKQPPVETELLCPKCSKKLKKDSWSYLCECGFRVPYVIAHVSISEEIMKEIFTNKKTANKIPGFVSKTGQTFEANLKLDEHDKIIFSFDD